jgi:molecular chaperone GrpE
MTPHEAQQQHPDQPSPETGAPAQDHHAPQAPSSAAEAEQPQAGDVQLAQAIAERDAHYERFLRAQAELENFRKRQRRESEEERKYATQPIIRDLLPAIDNLRRAADAARNILQAGDLVRGIDLVLQQLDAVLGTHGARPIEAVGKPFDPHLHEAVQQVPSTDHPPMTVVQELERGYTVHDRVIRPSKVIVSKGT